MIATKYFYCVCLFCSILMGCRNIKQVDVIEVQRICKLVMSNPDTLMSIRIDPAFSFNTLIVRKSEDRRFADSTKVIYLKKWFSSDYIIDTSFVYSKEYPFYNGEKTELIDRKIYRIEYRSKLTSIEYGTIEKKYFIFEFYNINDRWLLAKSDTLNIPQMRNKFNRLHRHPHIE